MRLKQLFLLCLLYPLFISCDNVTEEIRVKEDGSGEYVVYSDMVPAMQKMAVKMASMFGGESANADSLEKVMKDKIWNDIGEEVDSVIDFTSKMPEEFKNDLANKKFLENTTGFMKGGRKKGYVYSGMRYNFTDTDNLGEFQHFLQNSQKQNPQAGMIQGLNDAQSKVDFTFNEKSFTRQTTYIKKAQIAERDLAMIRGMIGNGKFQTVVYLPSNVKEVKGEHILKKEGNKVIFEYDILKMLTGDVNSDFEITFE